MSSSGTLSFWIPVTYTVPKIGFISTTISGTVLLILSYFGAQRNFGSYKYLMSAFTVLGIVFSFVETLVSPNVHNYKACAFFFSFEDSFGLSGLWLRNVPLVTYTFFHCATMSMLSVQFIYRYWAVFDTRKLQYFKGVYSWIWVGYCTFFGLQYSLGCFFFLKRDSTTDEYLRKEMLISYNVIVDELPGMAIHPYDPVDGSVRWWNIMGLINFSIILNFQYGIMMYCGWSMHSKMEDKIKNFSESLRKHHKQFFKTLVLQITMPTLILFVPITVILFLPVFNLDVSLPTGVVLCCFTLYPATDSIIVMYVVSEYRSTARTCYTFLHASIMSLLSVQFIYRYWAIFDNRKLTYFKGVYCIIWVVYCSFFGFQYSVASNFLFKNDETTNKYLREEMLIGYNVLVEDLPGLTILPYDPLDGSIRWWNIFGIMNVCFVVNFQYSVMIYCGWSMHVEMEDKIKNFSEALRKHHKQFFKTLILQITMPTIILFIPITIMIFLPLFNFDVSFPSGVMLCCFTLYPATDSIIVMYVVSEYKITAKKTLTAFYECIQNIKNSRVGASSAVISYTYPA